MNKKGMEFTLVTIFKVMAVLLVGVLIASKAVQFAEKDTIQKVNTIEDLSNMVNVLVGVPGDASLKYSSKTSLFTLLMNSNTIKIFKQGELEHNWITRNYFLPEGYTATGAIEEGEKICLKKINKDIILEACLENES